MIDQRIDGDTRKAKISQTGITRLQKALQMTRNLREIVPGSDIYNKVTSAELGLVAIIEFFSGKGWVEIPAAGSTPDGTKPDADQNAMPPEPETTF